MEGGAGRHNFVLRVFVDNLPLNISLVLFFIFLGGVFAASELALVSLRDSQLAGLEKKGRRGRLAASLAKDPNTFLGAVQIGVTVSGFFSAAFGATALAPVVIEPLRRLGLSDAAATVTAVITMTLVVAYLSLVFGELAPKRLALQRAEGFSLLVSPLIAGMARVFAPLIWLVGRSSDAVVTLLGGDPTKRAETMSNEELMSIVESHEGLDVGQREMLADVLDSAKHPIGWVMTPRPDVTTLPRGLTLDEAQKIVSDQPFSRYPLVTASLDDCESFVHVRDIMVRDAADRTLADIARPITIMPASMRVFAALTQLRHEGSHLALVVDEYGGADGLVTLEDLVEELIGEVFDEYDPVERVTDSDEWNTRGLISGDTTLHRFEELTGLTLPSGPYTTIAGYVMATVGDIPTVGDRISGDGLTLVVEEMDNRRILTLSCQIDPPPTDSTPGRQD
jgi:putative hemolysin